MADAPDENILKWPDLIYLADLMQSSGDKHVSLLGGEPSLHPHFVDFIIYLIERNLNVNIFTSGIFPDKTFEEAFNKLNGIPPERLSFVCNVNDPEKTSFSELQSVHRFLKAFGHLTTPGFNIYKPDFDLTFIFDYINKFGMKRFLRLGLAHPIPGKRNAFVAIEKMTKMVDKLMSFMPLFERFRVKPGFDCGFPMCIFKDEYIGQLFKAAGGRVVFGCGPAVDIGPDMTVWSCFPLSEFHKRSVYEFDSMQDIHKFYTEKHKLIRSEVGGIFEQCDDCKYREDGLCSGGCLAHILNNFQGEAKIRLPDIYNKGV